MDCGLRMPAVYIYTIWTHVFANINTCIVRRLYQKAHVTTGAQNEIPLDRFAGRSQGRRTAAKVPGYLSREAKEVCIVRQSKICHPSCFFAAQLVRHLSILT